LAQEYLGSLMGACFSNCLRTTDEASELEFGPAPLIPAYTYSTYNEDVPGDWIRWPMIDKGGDLEKQLIKMGHFRPE